MKERKEILKYFNEYHNLVYQEIYLKEKIEEKEGRLYSPRGVKYNNTSKSVGYSSDMVDKIEAKTELENELREVKKKKQRLKEEHIKEIIKAVDTPKKAQILILRYLHEENIKEISIMLRNSERHIERLKKEAVEELIKYLKCH